MAEVFIKHIHPLSSSYFLREIPRKKEEQQEDYLKNFDLHSLFYDVFISDDNYLTFIAPPVYEQKMIFELAKIEVNSQSITVKPEYITHSRTFSAIYKLDDDFANTIRANDTVDIFFSLGKASGHWNVPTRDFEILRNQDVFGAMNKDGELSWLYDWVEFNVRINHFTSVIIFDNNSSKYTVEELGNHLKNVPGLKKIVIIPWSVKFGVVAKPGTKTYDSDYGQYTALEMAHQRFLAQSRTFAHIDTDEYIYPLKNTASSIIEEVLESEEGALQILGYIALPIFEKDKLDTPISQLRARDFKYTNKRYTFEKNPIKSTDNDLKSFGARKYIVDMRRTPRDVQLGIHSFYKWVETTRTIASEIGQAFELNKYSKVLTSKNFAITHYTALSGSSWKKNIKRYPWDINNINDVKMTRMTELMVMEEPSLPQKQIINVYNYARANGKLNFGDLLSTPIVHKFFGNNSVAFQSVFTEREADLIAVGSVVQRFFKMKKKRDVWGAGLITKYDPNKIDTGKMVFHAVRGKLTRDLLHLPDDMVLGDPGLLANLVYEPSNYKNDKVGIIPHYMEKDNPIIKSLLNDDRFFVIDVERTPEEVIKDITSVKMVLSSSLHGLIVSDSFGVPNYWLKLTESLAGNGFKFEDYFSGVGREVTSSIVPINDVTFVQENIDKLYEEWEPVNDLQSIQKKLIAAFPYK